MFYSAVLFVSIILLSPKVKSNNYPSISLRAMSLSNSHIAIHKDCTLNKDCNKGICNIEYDLKSFKILKSECICYSPFVNHKGVCNYKQKDKSIAFLLSFFLGTFGFDW